MIKKQTQFMGLSTTINTTEQCNLRCKYCYELDKRNKIIDFDYIKKFINIILEDSKPLGDYDDTSLAYNNSGMILDFIGGDSLANPDIVDKALTYFQYKINVLDHIAKNNWRATLSTNGTYFQYKNVRKLLIKWKNVLNLGVSIDGNPKLHDLNRIFPDGTGSMKVILEWWPWFQKNFANEAKITKSTLAKCSIPYIFDSVKYMFENMGIIYINQNFIMEDANLSDEDFILFEEQMKRTCDYILERRKNIYWSMIDNNMVGHATYMKNDERAIKEKRGWCGSGGMPCLGIDGNIYPCFRWLPFTQSEDSKAKGMVVGHVDNGINGLNKNIYATIRDKSARINCTKDPKCLDCEYESACAYCIGGCYAEYGDFIRTTHICEIIKKQVKWARYYWDNYNKIENLPEEDWSIISYESK